MKNMIESLLGVGREEFIGEYLSVKCLIKNNDINDIYGPTSFDIDAAIAQYFDSPSRIRIVKNGSSYPALRHHGGQLNVNWLWEQYSKGWSIILNSVHKFDINIGNITRNLILDLGCKIQANLYLSPPQAQALSLHYDAHDVLVVQLLGRKNWSIYDVPDQQKQFFREKNRHEDLQGSFDDPITQVDLSEGFVAYIPRGTPHKALALEQPSLHVTFSLEPITIGDLIRGALEEAESNNEFFNSNIGTNFFQSDSAFYWDKILEESIARLNTENMKRKLVKSIKQRCLEDVYPTTGFDLLLRHGGRKL